jgi:hypothetical protein
MISKLTPSLRPSGERFDDRAAKRPSGSGGEGGFDVCAAKPTEVNKSAVGRRQRQLAQFDLATKQPVGTAGTLSTYGRCTDFS